MMKALSDIRGFGRVGVMYWTHLLFKKQQQQNPMPWALNNRTVSFAENH